MAGRRNLLQRARIRWEAEEVAVSHLSTCVGVGGGSFPWRAEDVTYFLG